MTSRPSSPRPSSSRMRASASARSLAGAVSTTSATGWSAPATSAAYCAWRSVTPGSMSSYRLCMMPSRPILGLPTGRPAGSALAVDVLVAVMQCLDAFRVEWDDVAERACEVDGPSHVLAHHRRFDGVACGGADREHTMRPHQDRGGVMALQCLDD